VLSDTIYALSSGRPPAGIGVIRISGPQAFAVSTAFLAGEGLPHPRRAGLRTLYNPADGDELDQILLLCFPGPNSVTGEDLAEWHCHGGQAVIRAILAALEEQGRAGHFSVREAVAGEFTRRGFENGRMDLNEAEGLADLLSAETESQRRAALRMADGHFSRRLEEWRAGLLACSAQVESLLDFSDEDDVPDDGMEQQLARSLIRLRLDMAEQLAAPSAERLRDGIQLVLAGPPNAGKSTLLNALAGREAAIVSDIAGTTRDRIEVPVNLGGIAFVLTDTAGLAEASEDHIERIGIDRAHHAIEAADILLWLGEVSRCPRGDALRVATQMDRLGWVMPEGADIAISAYTGENMHALIERIAEKARSFLPAEGGYALHERQRKAVAAIVDNLAAIEQEQDLLIVAEQLRGARGYMDRLIGRSGVEDMLDTLFSRFCIGK